MSNTASTLSERVEATRRLIRALKKEKEQLVLPLQKRIGELKADLIDMVRKHCDIQAPWMPGIHKCDNPFGTCVYDLDGEMGEDGCIFCEDPYEQK